MRSDEDPEIEGGLAQLLALMDEAYERKAWHGTTLRGSLRGLTPGQAAWRPRAGRHSIQELVVHAAYWKYAVTRRLTGERRGAFAYAGSNWFSRDDQPDATAWRRDVALLDECHRRLRETASAIAPAQLARRPRGCEQTRGFMLRGIAAHDLYHAGQIQLLKRLGPGR